MHSKILTLSIKGMSCGGCATNLTAKFQQQFPDVKFSADYTTHSGVLILDDQRELSPYLEFIDKLGFQAQLKSELQKGSLQSQWIKLATAFFCFGNIMMFAMVEYFATPGELSRELILFFRSLSALLATITVFYAGSEIYLNAWRGLLAKRFGVDFTISIAVFATYIYSLASLLPSLRLEPYFDSVAALILFLLSGRLVQRYFITKAENATRDTHTALKQFIHIESSKGIFEKPVNLLEVNEALYLYPGDVLPVKAELIDDVAEVSLDLITGESDSKNLKKGDQVESGAICLSQPTRWRSLEAGRDSYLKKLHSRAFELNFEKSQLMLLSDLYSSRFFFAVMIIAAVCFVATLQLGLEEAFFRTVAILLIACPCAFAVAVPLAATRCGLSALSSGVLFRNAEAMQNLSQIKKLIFDKTGTLTTGKLCIEALKECSKIDKSLWASLLTACKNSKHSVSQAVAENISHKIHDLVELQFYKELPGEGIEFHFKDRVFRLGKASYTQTPNVDVNQADLFWVELNSNGYFKDLLVTFQLSETINTGTRETISKLKDQGLENYILSGDTRERAEAVAEKISLPVQNVIADLKPEAKLEQITKHGSCAMIGNGYNDLLALSKSNVAISVANSDPSSVEVSDIHFLKMGIINMTDAIKFSKHMMRQLKLAFSFSIIYNVVGLTAAAFGYVTPVVAAIIMPINGVIVGVIAAKKLKDSL